MRIEYPALGRPAGTLTAVVLLLFATLGLSGCMVKEMADNLVYTVRGDYYLRSGDPVAGEAYFRQQVVAQPENAASNYYYGRLLLRERNAGRALPYLQKATALRPESSDYQFWLGVAYGLLDQGRQERVHYQQALRIDSTNEQALVALGHSFMRSHQYGQALATYGRALSLWPENPVALYNRGLALTRLGQKNEARRAWLGYLQANSSGELASTAVDHLNTLGDFSYRNYFLGSRVVAVQAVRFVEGGAAVAPESVSTVVQIGEVAARQPARILQIVVYRGGDARLAKARALGIRQLLLAKVPGLSASRVGVSWFGQPWRNSRKKWYKEEAVDFFLTDR
ncbi:MAG: tetratricopeptide repeat protein [Desulfopila sp.]